MGFFIFYYGVSMLVKPFCLLNEDTCTINSLNLTRTIFNLINGFLKKNHDKVYVCYSSKCLRQRWIYEKFSILFKVEGACCLPLLCLIKLFSFFFLGSFAFSSTSQHHQTTPFTVRLSHNMQLKWQNDSIWIHTLEQFVWEPWNSVILTD